MSWTAIFLSVALSTASPPPPPPEAPESAQGAFDGFAGPDLWRAWQRAVRTRAVALRNEAYADAGALSEAQYRGASGPTLESYTGYWNEGYTAAFFEVCERSSYACNWRYVSARLTGRLGDYDAVTLDTFDAPALAAYLRQTGVTPEAFDPRETELPATDRLDQALAPFISLVVRSETRCAAVGEWRGRLQAADPILLSGFEPDPTQPPPPPSPLRETVIVNVPTTAYFTADVMVRFEGRGNRALGELWDLITEGINVCTGPE